jgi:two-component system, cell cycle response regulator DivK
MAQVVLLVEDNFDNRSIYRTILEVSGYTVVEALDGKAAIERAREVQPDLILMDISIPEVDGWEATRVLKGDPATSKIPIVALTAHAMAEDRRRAQDVGFDGYLAKPVPPRDVVEEVHRFLRRASATAGEGIAPPASGSRPSSADHDP